MSKREKVPGLDADNVTKDLAFPVEEFKNRWKQLVARLNAEGIDLLMVTTPENIYYLTGYHTPGYYAEQMLLFPISGNPILITRATEEMNVRAVSCIDDSDSYTDDEDPSQRFAEAVQEMGFVRARIGVEKNSWFLTTSMYENLTKRLPESTFVDASMRVEECRVIKSDAEICYIKKAASIASLSMHVAVESVKEGVSENEVAAEVYAASIRAGSEYAGLPAFVASGIRSSMTHATWSGRIIEDSDPVLLELPGCVRRYGAALMRTVFVGKPHKTVQHMYDTAKRALENMLPKICPGRPLEEAWEVWRHTLSQAGFEERYRRTGYSIGVNFPPDWGEGHILSFKRGEKRLLEPNMTFHIPSIVKQFGRANAGFSETVRVTQNGCEILTDYADSLTN